MATCSAMSRIRSATDPDSIVVAQTLVCVVDLLIQAHRVNSVLPFAQKKKWAKTHRTTHPRSEQALDYTGRIEWKQARLQMRREKTAATIKQTKSARIKRYLYYCRSA